MLIWAISPPLGPPDGGPSSGSRIQPGEFRSLKLPPLEMQTFARAWSGGKRHRDLTESLSGDTHIKLTDTSCDYSASER